MENEIKGCVYFFRHIGLTPVKIGYSTNESPLNRFNQFKTYAPYGSEILGFIQTDESKTIETKLHLKYANKRLSGEWFEITEQDVKTEVDFYSNIEDIKERNEFQIQWANHINKRKFKVITNNMTLEDKKEIFLSRLKENPKLNKTHFANEFKISRRAIYYWINN
jgi:hypothetical protein